MKFIFFLVLYMFSQSALPSIQRNFDINVVISKKSKTDEVEIISPENNYTAIYNNSLEKFDNIVIPYAVKSPLSVSADSYKYTLSESSHFCDGNPLNVSVLIDGVVLNRGESILNADFNQSDSTNKWRDHILTLEYEVQDRLASEQVCSGLVGITVELEI